MSISFAEGLAMLTMLNTKGLMKLIYNPLFNLIQLTTHPSPTLKYILWHAKVMGSTENQNPTQHSGKKIGLNRRSRIEFKY